MTGKTLGGNVVGKVNQYCFEVLELKKKFLKNYCVQLFYNQGSIMVTFLSIEVYIVTLKEGFKQPRPK